MDPPQHILTSTLRADASFMALYLNAMNSEVKYKNTLKMLKDWEPAVQFKIMADTRRQLIHFTKKYHTKLEEYQAAHQASDKSPEEDYKLAQRKGELKRQLSNAQTIHGIKYSEWDYAGLMAIMAENAATRVEMDQQVLNEGAGFKIKFNDCPLEDIGDKVIKLRVTNLLERYGPIIMEELVLSKNRELWVTFETAEGKQRCMEAGRTPELGQPTTPLAHAYVDNFAPFSIYIDGIKDNTTEADVRNALGHHNVFGSSVTVKDNAAIVGIEEEEDFYRAISIRRIAICNRTVNIVAGRNSDPDELKGILGFWQGRTTHLNKLYKILDSNENWRPPYVQPAFWKNGALKHYYFIRFRTVADKERAMATPLRIGDEIIQVYDIERDDHGRLELPMEGAWRKRTRPSNDNPIQNQPAPIPNPQDEDIFVPRDFN